MYSQNVSEENLVLGPAAMRYAGLKVPMGERTEKKASEMVRVIG